MAYTINFTTIFRGADASLHVSPYGRNRPSVDPTLSPSIGSSGRSFRHASIIEKPLAFSRDYASTIVTPLLSKAKRYDQVEKSMGP